MPKKPVVFVLMPFNKKYDDVFILVLKSLESELEIIVNRADIIPFDNRRIYDQIIGAIDSADLIIADISETNPNVFYELGYAHARGKLVIPQSCDNIKNIPFDVAGFQTISYKLNDLNKLKSELVIKVKQVLDLISKHRIVDKIITKDSEDVIKIRNYAIAKAKKNNWTRPEMYFTQEAIVTDLHIENTIVYEILNELRNRGVITCVNYGGESVWMATSRE